MATAKNCALNALRRERTARTFAPDLGRLIQNEWTATMVEELFMPKEIKDDQLRMMFSYCHAIRALLIDDHALFREGRLQGCGRRPRVEFERRSGS